MAVEYVQAAAAAASLAKSLFGGGGKTPSVLQGFEVTGRVSNARGFEGTIEAFDQKGNRWDASVSNPIGDLFAQELKFFKLPDDYAAPVLFQVPTAPGQMPLLQAVRDTLGAASLMNTESVMTPAGTPNGADTVASGSGTAAGTVSGVAPQPTFVIPDSGMGQLIPVLLMLGVGYYLMKKG